MRYGILCIDDVSEGISIRGGKLVYRIGKIDITYSRRAEEYSRYLDVGQLTSEMNVEDGRDATIATSEITINDYTIDTHAAPRE
jgi:hypothetical protein